MLRICVLCLLTLTATGPRLAAAAPAGDSREVLLPDPSPAREQGVQAEKEGEETETSDAQTIADEADAVPPLPTRKPKPPGPVHPSEAEAEPWSEAEIAAAQSACSELLKDLPVKYLPVAPIREGQCGTPAPVSVTAIGDDPEIAIAPGAIISCPMAAALARWIRTSVQPTARKHLGAPVVKFKTFASYVCRNRYNNPNKKISEHARANALDIGAFELSTGETVTVLTHWNAQTAAPPPLPERTPWQQSADETDDTSPSTVTHDEPSRTTSVVRRAAASPAAAKEKEDGETEAPPPKPEPDKRSLFLRGIHEEACGVFGTVLGPEANAAHANHFHLDMAPRRHSAFCE